MDVRASNVNGINGSGNWNSTRETYNAIALSEVEKKIKLHSRCMVYAIDSMDIPNSSFFADIS